MSCFYNQKLDDQKSIKMATKEKQSFYNVDLDGLVHYQVNVTFTGVNYDD